MTISQVLLLIFLAFLCGRIKNLPIRNALLLPISLLIYYRFQTATPILFLDFWLPTLAILLTLLVWIASQSQIKIALKENAFPLILVLLTLLAISANRYLNICCLTPTRPPPLWTVVLTLLILLVPSTLLFSKISVRTRLGLLIFIAITIFIALKTPELSLFLSKFFRWLNQQDLRFSSSNDVLWLGISYILFRLLHLLLDWRAGRLPVANLEEIFNYIFFFPALVAGPIARFTQFRNEISNTPQPLDTIEGSRRILIGLFRKFVLADSLALLSLSSQNASQIHSPLFLWMALIAYSFRIYFDFSGYTDIALGSARLMGIRLPENFNAPYFKSSLIHFWNSWHITLADWFRSYVFNPLTRKLRASPALPNWLTIFIPQLSTMLLIGLWHGITPNFFLWGAWHGVGLFINNRWNALKKPSLLTRSESLQKYLGWTLTFGYVTLGWVWFLMPTFAMAVETFQKLFGIGI
jgi:D-alanyl-lipoteichoic acid acyltransferase DltB (MBOAT superfamily)